MRLLAAIAPPFCAACRRPAPAGEPLCPACDAALERLPSGAVALAGLGVWAPVAYAGPGRELIRRLKFGGAVRLAEHMAAAIAAGAPSPVRGRPLVPVPSPVGRRRRRGYCHAELIARALAAHTGVPVLPLLERVGGHARQVGRPRRQRMRAPPRFRALRAEAEEVVLVDDVATTGATLAACARALAAAGWRCEHALAYARTPVR